MFLGGARRNSRTSSPPDASPNAGARYDGGAQVLPPLPPAPLRRAGRDGIPRQPRRRRRRVADALSRADLPNLLAAAAHRPRRQCAKLLTQCARRVTRCARSRSRLRCPSRCSCASAARGSTCGVPRRPAGRRTPPPRTAPARRRRQRRRPQGRAARGRRRALARARGAVRAGRGARGTARRDALGDRRRAPVPAARRAAAGGVARAERGGGGRDYDGPTWQTAPESDSTRSVLRALGTWSAALVG